VAPSFEQIADVWLAHVRDQENAWFGVNPSAFLERLPSPGRATLEIGCGEGRFGRELVALGHRLTGVDASSKLAALARESFDVVEADAAALPFENASFDLVVAFMCLMDIDEMESAVREAARVLEQGRGFSASIVHPILSAGEGEPFTISSSYLEPHRYLERMVTNPNVEFESIHRPLEAYTSAFEDAGLLIVELRELQGVRRPHLPISLHLHAVKR
jgi:ubiquinone/menaquinone biosynthesis C-methylase UbiE